MPCNADAIGMPAKKKKGILSAECAEFGRRVRTLRDQRDWSQEELAFRADISMSHLNDLELGKAEPCLVKMKAIAAALGVSLVQMVRGL